VVCASTGIFSSRICCSRTSRNTGDTSISRCIGNNPSFSVLCCGRLGCCIVFLALFNPFEASVDLDLELKEQYALLHALKNGFVLANSFRAIFVRGGKLGQLLVGRGEMRHTVP